MSGFKNFIMRGNLVQLAVVVVIGTAPADYLSRPPTD
jgi:large-conductance mechanosensitive channel